MDFFLGVGAPPLVSKNAPRKLEKTPPLFSCTFRRGWSVRGELVSPVAPPSFCRSIPDHPLPYTGCWRNETYLQRINHFLLKKGMFASKRGGLRPVVIFCFFDGGNAPLQFSLADTLHLKCIHKKTQLICLAHNNVNKRVRWSVGVGVSVSDVSCRQRQRVCIPAASTKQCVSNWTYQNKEQNVLLCTKPQKCIHIRVNSVSLFCVWLFLHMISTSLITVLQFVGVLFWMSCSWKDAERSRSKGRRCYSEKSLSKNRDSLSLFSLSKSIRPWA